MIYAMTMEDGKFVKIGYTKHADLEKRAGQLQTGTPYYIRAEFCVEGTLPQEVALHAALKVAFHRIRIKLPGNEWYPARHPFMKEFVGTLRESGPNAALSFAERYNPAVRQWGTGRKFDEKNRLRMADERAWLMTLAFLIAMNVVNNPFTVAVCAGGSLFWLMRATFPAFDRFWSEP